MSPLKLDASVLAADPLTPPLPPRPGRGAPAARPRHLPPGPSPPRPDGLEWSPALRVTRFRSPPGASPGRDREGVYGTLGQRLGERASTPPNRTSEPPRPVPSRGLSPASQRRHLPPQAPTAVLPPPSVPALAATATDQAEALPPRLAELSPFRLRRDTARPEKVVRRRAAALASLSPSTASSESFASSPSMASRHSTAARLSLVLPGLTIASSSGGGGGSEGGEAQARDRDLRNFRSPSGRVAAVASMPRGASISVYRGGSSVGSPGVYRGGSHVGSSPAAMSPQQHRGVASAWLGRMVAAKVSASQPRRGGSVQRASPPPHLSSSRTREERSSPVSEEEWASPQKTAGQGAWWGCVGERERRRSSAA